MELNEESSQARAEVLVLKTAVSHIYSMSLKCAIDLGIFDIVHNHGSPMTLHDLVSALAIPQGKAESLRRLMRLLTHSGFFSLQWAEPSFADGSGGGSPQQEAYVLTTASRLLLKGNRNPSNISLRPMVEYLVNPKSVQPYDDYGKWFHNDSRMTPFEMRHGKTLYDYCAHDPSFNILFNEGMASDSRGLMSAIIDKSRRSLEQSKSLVDVGGGTGLLAKAIADEFPRLEVTVLDLPHVVRGLEGKNNLKFMEGDMFNYVPPANIIMLKWILHNWNDEECMNILKRCKEAIALWGRGKDPDEEGKVMVIDMVIGENKEATGWSEIELLHDMFMMTALGGRERTENEWAKLFADVGFSKYEITPIVSSKCIIEVYP